MNSNTDKLEYIFELQRNLNERIGVPSFTLMSEIDRAEWAMKFSLALSHERIEMERELEKSWKYWKKTATIDIKAAKEEATDMMFFLVSIMQALGMDAQELLEMYIDKNKENIRRQNNGY